MFKPNNTHKTTIALAVTLLAVFAAAYFILPASAWTSPTAGYITEVTWSATWGSADGSAVYGVYLDSTQIATFGAPGNFGGSDGAATSVSVWTASGVSHTVSYALISGSGDVSSFSGDVTGFTSWYLITVNSAYGSPTSSAYVASGGSYEVSVTTPVSLGTGVRAVCDGYTIDGGSLNPGSTYTFTGISSDHTITFNWNIQYEVIFQQTGLDASASGTVLTYGYAYSYGDFPVSAWVTSGSSIDFSYGSTVASSTTGKQFRLSSYNYASPQTITAPITVTYGYTTQYKLTVSTTYSSPYPAAATWYDAGSTVSCTVTSSTVAGSTGYQYVFASWTGSGSGSYTGSNIYPTNIVMNAPITETAVWQTQCYLSVTSTYFVTTGSGWYNLGASASFNLTSPISGGVGTQISFNGWVGSGTGSYTGATQYNTVTMDYPITETANTYATQYYLTVVSAYGTTSGGGWYASGATAYAGLNTGSVTTGTGTRQGFVSWDVGGTNSTQSNPITMNYPVTATASWSTQYYLTVNSLYGTPSGANWYNAGASAIASVSPTINGTYTFQGWSGDASGGSYTSPNSNIITMSSPKTATAVWSGGSSAPAGPVSYNVTLIGPYYEDGAVSTDTVSCLLYYANSTVYPFTLTSSLGTPGTVFISSTSPFTQLTWNASSTSATLNATRIYRFANGANAINDTTINIYILYPTKPAFEYTFSVSDYYGMIDPFLETSVSPYGNATYVVERVNLNETGGYVTFVMQQYQPYTLTFICQQGSYTQTFTPNVQGAPGQQPINLNVLAGNFPSTTSTSIITAYANRTGTSTIYTTYLNPTENATTWVALSISHRQGATSIIDYATNTTGDSVTFSWGLADANTEYTVTVTALSGGVTYTFTLSVPSVSGDNPWASIDWTVIGTYMPTLPTSYTGWGGIDPTQLLAAMLILFALGIGSYFSTGMSCIVSWVIAGVLLAMGWWQGSIPLFCLAGFFSVLVLIDEYKKGAFNL